VKPLAFGQYGELRPGFEQLREQLSEEGADEKRPAADQLCDYYTVHTQAKSGDIGSL
jgi:hypothetical protein